MWQFSRRRQACGVLGSPKGLTTGRRASPEPPIIGRTSITEKEQTFPGCTLFIYVFWFNILVVHPIKNGCKDVFRRFKALFPPSPPHTPTHFLPPVGFLIRFSGSFEWCSSMCGLHRLNGCVTVKGMAFRIGLLATRLPISECFRGASIGFVGHKTADSVEELPYIVWRISHSEYPYKLQAKGVKRGLKCQTCGTVKKQI